LPSEQGERQDQLDDRSRLVAQRARLEGPVRVACKLHGPLELALTPLFSPTGPARGRPLPTAQPVRSSGTQVRQQLRLEAAAWGPLIDLGARQRRAHEVRTKRRQHADAAHARLLEN